jgi:hypothetical protein
MNSCQNGVDRKAMRHICAVSGRARKINLYQDDGSVIVNVDPVPL